MCCWSVVSRLAPYPVPSGNPVWSETERGGGRDGARSCHISKVTAQSLEEGCSLPFPEVPPTHGGSKAAETGRTGRVRVPGGLQIWVFMVVTHHDKGGVTVPGVPIGQRESPYHTQNSSYLLFCSPGWPSAHQVSQGSVAPYSCLCSLWRGPSFWSLLLFPRFISPQPPVSLPITR